MNVSPFATCTDHQPTERTELTSHDRPGPVPASLMTIVRHHSALSRVDVAPTPPSAPFPARHHRRAKCKSATALVLGLEPAIGLEAGRRVGNGAGAGAGAGGRDAGWRQRGIVAVVVDRVRRPSHGRPRSRCVGLLGGCRSLT